MSGDTSLVAVALPLPIDHTFTYSVKGTPPDVGTRVLVPFRAREWVGWVVGPADGQPVRGLKSVLTVLDERPSVPPDLLELARWIADYYVCPLGIVLRSMLPAVLSDVSRDYIALVGEIPADLKPRERRLAQELAGRPDPQRVQTLRKAIGMGSIWPEIRSLQARGLLAHETVPPKEPGVKTRRVVRVARHLDTLDVRDEVFGRATRQREAYELLEASGGAAELAHLTAGEGFSRSVIQGLEEKALVELVDEEEIRDPFAADPPGPPADLVPTADQRAALAAMVAALDRDESAPFLLQGITGSGKTLVYIELLREALARGRTAIVLVPEIALTPQTAQRFRAQFGDRVAVLHSGLSHGERYDAWRGLRSGERRIAVGARSALFAPLPDLGVVVVDEEHDGSYKQSDAPATTRGPGHRPGEGARGGVRARERDPFSRELEQRALGEVRAAVASASGRRSFPSDRAGHRPARPEGRALRGAAVSSTEAARAPRAGDPAA